MKNRCLITLIQSLCAFSAFELFAQDVTIDASKIKSENIFETNFEKPFKIDFINNNDLTASIKVSDSDGVPTTIKKEFLASEKQHFVLEFIVVSRDLKMRLPSGGERLMGSPIELFYGNKKITIVNAVTGATEKANSPGTAQKITGIEIHDAILAKRFYDTNNDSLYLILGLYKNLSIGTSPQDIKDAYKNNIYITKLLETFRAEPLEEEISPFGKNESKLKGLLTKVGDVDVTNFADGVARFLVKRTKEELNIAFFQHFKEVLNDDRAKDVRILFPKTLEILNAINQDVYQFENYITTLRESFENDLSLLLDHFPGVIEEGNFSQYFSSHPDLKYSLLLALNSSRELVNGTHPGKVIETLPQEYIDGIKTTNVKGAIETVQLFSASLRSRQEEKYWTSLDTVAFLTNKKDTNKITARFYLGLLYEKSEGVQFSDKNSLQYYLTSTASSLDSVNQYILFTHELARNFHDVEAAVAQIRDKNPGVPSMDHYYRLFHSFSNVLEQINNVGDLPWISVGGQITDQVENYIKIFRQTNDLALNVSRRNYNSAILNTYNIYLVATELKKTAGQDGVNLNSTIAFDNPGPATKETSADAKAASLTEKKKKKLTKDINEAIERNADLIKKYGTFMANVVKANSPDEVAAAIEAVALPVGSATIKKHSQINISLNAYVGPYIGSEKIDGLDKDFSTNAYGVTAPIGVAISKGWNTASKNGWSTSLFLSMIDLGAPVAFRFKEDATEEIPSVKLKDIVSPGIFLSFGLPRVPLSLNCGWQMGPLLRQVNTPLEENSYSRLSFSVVVDIPILNFYKSGK